MNEQQYCIYTGHDDFIEVCTWLKVNDLKREHHLNRTRFWVPQDKMQEFMTTYYYACMKVNPNEDLATGITPPEDEEYSAMVRIIKQAHEGDLAAENAYLHKILKHTYADRTRAFFICGQGGDVDAHGLPSMMMICPSYGADGFALYTKTKDYDAPSY